MADDMEVDMDVFPAFLFTSDKKHFLMSPQPSSIEKRPKLDAEQVAINNKISEIACSQRWQNRIDEAGNDSECRNFFSDIILYITSMNLQDIIPPQLVGQSRAIANNLSEKELREWRDAVRKSLKEGDWADFLSHPKLRATISASSSAESGDFPRPLSDQEKATEISWLHPFQGDAARELWEYIVTHFQSSSTVYAHYAVLVQSSGMGKSRTVDEIAKNHFLIPINLRGGKHTGKATCDPFSIAGYPPADDDVRNYLAVAHSRNGAYNRSCAFLEALFTHTNTVLRSFDSTSYDEMAAQFRDFMNKGQTISGHNDNRKKFFSAVIEKAKELRKNQNKPNAANPCYSSEYPPCKALATLVTFINSICNPPPSPTPSKSKKKKKPWIRPKPVITLCFDEAHTLTTRIGTGLEEWSILNELRHALRTVQNLPVFTLFLSTTGKFSQFTSATREDRSARVIAGNLILIPPFTDFGFDHLTEIISLGGEWNLEKLTADAYISLLGRPLIGTRYLAGGGDITQELIQFAAGKLLNAQFTIEELSNDQILACLSQRLPIEFQSTNYITQASERKQVEDHMRVCLNVDAAFETMTTTSSSEPLLSEAAYFIMQKPSFNAVAALKSVMEDFAISKGDRGEFLVLLLLTLARDAAVGPADKFGRPVDGNRWFGLSDFLCEQVFRVPDASSDFMNEESIIALENLVDDFPDAQLHFNHFVKIHETIDITSLLLLLGRGAGVLCANNQRGIDSITAFLKSGTMLSRQNAGLLIKNDAKFSHVLQDELFTAMDPYKLGIIEPGDGVVPLIKIVFALAAKTPYLNVVRHAPTKDYNAITYEIWCAGISPDILGPVQCQDVGLWDALLQASYGWKDLYETKSKVLGDLRRSAAPGAALDQGHWAYWADRK